MLTVVPKPLGTAAESSSHSLSNWDLKAEKWWAAALAMSHSRTHVHLHALVT